MDDIQDLDIDENIEIKQTFLVKLYEMVDNELTNWIICWLDDGTGFKILDIDAFCN